MEKRQTRPKQGTILIAEPSLRDYYFRQSVVLLAEHNAEGTFGLIINKPVEVRLRDVLKGFPSYSQPVFLGGPVNTENLFYLHTMDDIDDCLQIMQGLYWGGNLEMIREKMHTGEVQPESIRFFLGYSGWSPNQLDREIKEKSWVLSHSDTSGIMSNHPEKMWANYLRSMGQDYAIWANFPADISLN